MCLAENVFSRKFSVHQSVQSSTIVDARRRQGRFGRRSGCGAGIKETPLVRCLWFVCSVCGDVHKPRNSTFVASTQSLCELWRTIPRLAGFENQCMDCQVVYTPMHNYSDIEIATPVASAAAAAAAAATAAAAAITAAAAAVAAFSARRRRRGKKTAILQNKKRSEKIMRKTCHHRILREKIPVQT